MSVTFANGFEVAGISSGLKASGKLDTCLLVNEGSINSFASVWTTNRVHSAPVRYSREALNETNGLAKAFILNSGSANACTGKAGIKQSEDTAKFVAKTLGIPNYKEVQVSSTGRIGELIDLDKLFPGIEHAKTKLSSTIEAGEEAATAILTTDTFKKTATLESKTGYKIGGMVKGAGMIAPAMATMIAVVTTDALIDSKTLQRALDKAVKYSFNRIDADGCMSTNDTFCIMASGESGVEPDYEEFAENLTTVAKELAKQIIQDCEGATHDILVKVINVDNEDGALEVARSVSRSNLLKCAIAGNDPNWGRILANVGVVPESKVKFNQDEIDVYLNNVKVAENGAIGEDKSKVDLASNREVEIVIDLKSGTESAELWTNDLTYEYVRINSEYAT
jgi:glutamate N-acetyltransferase/amino-acid N-acetyltransferase